VRYDDSNDNIWQRRCNLKAYLLWNWNSFNSPKFYFCQGREDVNSKHTYCGTGIPSIHQSFIFVRAERTSTQSMLTVELEFLHFTKVLSLSEQRGRKLKAYLLWNWNSFNSPKFYLCQSREDVNSKHTYCGTGILSIHQSFIFVRAERTSTQSILTVELEFLQFTKVLSLSEMRAGKDMQENPQCILPHTLPDVYKKLDICIKGTKWSYS
jgi:hypothetical protein